METPLALCRFAAFAPLLFLFGASLHVALFAPADLARDLGAVSYTHLTLPTNREV